MPPDGHHRRPLAALLRDYSPPRSPKCVQLERELRQMSVVRDGERYGALCRVGDAFAGEKGTQLQARAMHPALQRADGAAGYLGGILVRLLLQHDHL